MRRSQPVGRYERSFYLYVIVARMFTDWCLEQRRQGLLPDDGHPPVWLRTLNVDLVLRWLKSLDSAPTTVNSHRGTILTLWRRAAATRDKITGKRLVDKAVHVLDHVSTLVTRL